MSKMVNIAVPVIAGIILLSAFGQPGPKPEQKVEISTRYGNIVVRLFNETPQHRDNFIGLVKKGFYDSLMFHRIIPTFMIQGGDPKSKYALPGQLLGDGDLGYKIPAEFHPGIFHKRGALGAARDNNPEKASNSSQFYIVQGRTFTSQELINMENSYNYAAKRKMFEDVMRSDSVRIRLDDFTLRGDKEGLHRYMASLEPLMDSAFAPQEFRFTTRQMSAYASKGGAPHLDMLGYTVFGEVISGMNVVDSIVELKRDSMDRPLVDLRMKMRLLK
jgi:cyclophilin family peptidyl-prolyl cis-trans isomerase